MNLLLAIFATLVAAALSNGAKAPERPEVRWDRATAMTQARLMQPFIIDGIDVRIDRVTPVSTFADGTPPDESARVIEVEYWARNPQAGKVDFFDRFYAYAVMRDGSDTDGEGLSFYPMGSNSEFGDVTLDPAMVQHARFDVEVPANGDVVSLVVFGPLDGSKVTIALPQARQKM